jgi:hypothetical protein
MSNFCASIILALLLTGSAPLVFAGGSTGGTGGGTGTVSKEGKKVLLDLLEADEDLNGPLIPFDPWKEKAFRDFVSDRLNKIEGKLPYNREAVLDKIKEITSKTRFVFSEKPLEDTKDTCLLVKIPEKSQAAIQKDGTVRVYAPWYKTADKVNRAALLMHEIVMMHNHQPICSDVVRKAVRAMAFPEKTAAGDIVQLLFRDGLGLTPQEIFVLEEEKGKAKILAALGPGLEKYCQHNFTSVGNMDCGAGGGIILCNLRDAMREAIVGLPESLLAQRVLFERLAGTVSIFGRFGVYNSDWQPDEGYNPKNDLSTPIASCPRKHSQSFCLEIGQKIKKQECEVFAAWKNSNRDFVSVAKEIRSPLPDVKDPMPGNSGKLTKPAGDASGDDQVSTVKAQ